MIERKTCRGHTGLFKKISLREYVFLVLWALLSLGITVLITTGQSCQLTHLALSVRKFVIILVSVFSCVFCK